MSDSTALILGFGYLARPVARLWTGQGIGVFATTRRLERFAELRELGIEPIQWDVLQTPDELLPRVDTVLYCVGFDRSAGRPMRDIYVDGLRRTLERLSGTGRVIYVSSTGVYGDAHGGWVDETTLPSPTDPSGEVCLEAERVLWDVCGQRQIPAIALRLAGIYGPGRLIGVAALRAGEPIGSEPDTYLNLIHVADAARVVDAARTNGRPGETYLVSDGAPVRRREFYEYLADRLQTPPPVFEPSARRRQRGDRRCRNRKMQEELLPTLLYPDFRAAFEQSEE